jgi:hypothetical protein
MLRKRNWRCYNKELVQRGSLLFLIDPKLLKNPKKQGLGRPQMFSDALISALFMIKIFFKLPCSALQGFASFVQPLINKLEKVPDYTSICIRAKKLALASSSCGY